MSRAQGAGANNLADMPSVDRVKNEIKGSDPVDTMARQVAVFTYLQQFVERIKYNRTVRGPYTAEEGNLLAAYSLASYQITQAYAKSHSPAEASAFDRLHWKYESGEASDWAAQLMGKQSTAAYKGAQSGLAAIAKAHFDEERRVNEEAVARQKELKEHPQESPDSHYATDPGSVAARHCIESGRSETECLGEAFKVGMKDLMGGDPLEGMVPATPAGLRLTGQYVAGQFGLQFRQDSVILGCGKLVPQTLQYNVQRSGLQITVTIPISPKPLVLSFKDNKLTGPGPIAVDGLVPIGGMTDTASTTYELQSQTSTTQRQISALEAPNYGVGEVHQNGMEYSVDQQTTSSSWVPATTHHYSVPTAPKTEHCNVGTMQSAGESFSASGLLTQVLGSKASKSANAAPGLRLNGTYAAPGGLKIEFRDDSATLQCGESFNSEAYEVLPEGGQLIVKFQNNTGPFSLVLQPNGTLTGSGEVDVAGRKVVQSSNGGLDYLPRNARCSLGTFQTTK
jgi:hypothetical protein